MSLLVWVLALVMIDIKTTAQVYPKEFLIVMLEKDRRGASLGSWKGYRSWTGPSTKAEASF